MSVLSLPATARLLERHVRQTGPATRDQLLGWLASIDVSHDHAEAGLRLAVTVGCLEPVTDDDGATRYRLPEPRARAA